jgi:hypothetical protein
MHKAAQLSASQSAGRAVPGCPGRIAANAAKLPELLKRRTENRRRLRLGERCLIGCLVIERFR